MLGLVTLLVAGLSAVAVTDPALRDAVGTGFPLLIVLGSLLIGSIAGSALRIEDRLEGLAGRIQAWVARRWRTEGGTDHAARERFIEGWLTASLLFCVGPLTILGSLNDGLGRGIDQLALKSVLDGFAAMAFAASFGVGVMLSAVSVLVVQGAADAVRGAARRPGARRAHLGAHGHRRAAAGRHRAAAAADPRRPGRRHAARPARRPPAHPARRSGSGRGRVGPGAGRPVGQAFSMPATTASATSRMPIRRSMAVFWIQRKASASVIFSLVMQHALGAVDGLAGLEPVAEVGDLGLERLELGASATARCRWPGVTSPGVNGLTT